MAVFPEHLHIEDEDTLLKRAESETRYRHLLEGFLGVLVIGGLSLIAAIVVLALL